MFAQKPINLEGADELEGVEYKGQKANLLNGNVRVEHDGTKMRCNKAYLYGDGEDFDAFGNVRIVQPSGMTIYGDSLFYNTKTKIAKFRGNVRVVDNGKNINTNYLDFNTEERTAWYYGGGTINDNGTHLTSQTGFYDSEQAFYSFKGDVIVTKEGNKIVADTLKYASGTQKVYFFGPTTVTSKDQTLYAESGIYNTKEEEGWFSENSWVESSTYKLYGDSLYFNNKTNYGYAIKNVRIESFEENATIYGDVAITEGEKNTSTVFGHALLMDREDSDTTYILADTLVSVTDTVTNTKDVYAYRQVKIIKGDLSGKCDSLVYSETDSTISFYHDPILWNNGTQITSDSIIVTMAYDQVDKMFAYVDAFLISKSEKDTSRYDQVKGRDMIAYFEEGQLGNLDVDGNGESVYYAYNDKDQLIGLNTVICSAMKMFMVDRDMDNIRFYDRPIAHFIPPQLIKEENRFLDEFKWRESEMPLVSDLLSVISERENIDINELFIPDEEVELDSNEKKTVEGEKLTRKEKRKIRKQKDKN